MFIYLFIYLSIFIYMYINIIYICLFICLSIYLSIYLYNIYIYILYIFIYAYHAEVIRNAISCCQPFGRLDSNVSARSRRHDCVWMGKPSGEVGDLSAMFAGVDVHIISYYDHIMIWYDMIWLWFSMFPIYVRPSTCRPFFTCLQGSLVIKTYTGVGSVSARHQRHLNWWWLPEPLAMISTPRSPELMWLWVKREDSCNVRPPSDVCWFRFASIINHSYWINQLSYLGGLTLWFIHDLIWGNMG